MNQPSPNRRLAAFGLLLGAAAAALGFRCLGQEASPPARVRVGTFESRAITVAYVPSKLNTAVQDLKAEYKKAEAAGDKKRMEELKARGSKLQDKLDRQGFGRAPVNDLLAPIRESLPEVCREAGVDLIAWDIVHAGPGVEVVDVTDHLVKRYQPSEKTLKTIAELRNRPPLEDEAFPLKN